MADHSERHMGRSILAIFVGFVVVVVLSLVADFTMYALHFAPSPGQRMSDPLLGVALAYRTLFAVLGCYLTARLAPFGPMLHAMIGGVIGFCLGMIGAVATWNTPQATGAHWYPIAVAVVALPAAWLGGRLYRAPVVASAV